MPILPLTRLFVIRYPLSVIFHTALTVHLLFPANTAPTDICPYPLPLPIDRPAYLTVRLASLCRLL
jgi:hypothetical protein